MRFYWILPILEVGFSELNRNETVVGMIEPTILVDGKIPGHEAENSTPNLLRCVLLSLLDVLNTLCTAFVFFDF